MENLQIPKWAQSSVNPENISLTLQSLGKAVAGIIAFAGVVGLVDPVIAQAAWGNFVASVITAVPAAYAVWHSGEALFGLIRKVVVRIFGTKTTV